VVEYTQQSEAGLDLGLAPLLLLLIGVKMKTRIYIDVDGVLNALPRRGTTTMAISEKTGWDEYRSARINGYVITWATGLVNSLNSLAEQEDIELVWVTTWRDLARTHIAPGIGLNGQDWRFLTDGGEATGHLWGTPGQTWWKLTAVRDDVRQDPVDRIIWIDDDLPLHTDAIEWALERGVTLVTPELSYGLTLSDVEGISEIVGALNEA
jgi:hypothetical protein